MPIGGSASIGLSADMLSGTPSRPLPPFSSVLLDETLESVFPLSVGVPLASLESMEDGKARLVLATNILFSGNSSQPFTAEELKNCWNQRAKERWDARWALRFVQGIENYETGITGLRNLDERILLLDLSRNYPLEKLERALTTQALRISKPSLMSGTGPFIRKAESADRCVLTCEPSHHMGRAYLDEVSVIGYPSISESALDFSRGSLHGLVISSNELDQYISTSKADPGRMESLCDSLLVLLFNPVRLPILNERKGLAFAVDKKGIADNVLGGESVPVGDFLGGESGASDWAATFEQARILYSSGSVKRDHMVILVCDDPAAKEAAGRIRANWETLGVPVEIRQNSGPLMLSYEAEAVLLALRIPVNGEGVLPECLALYDRSSWWEPAAIALGGEKAKMIRGIRNLDQDGDLRALGDAMMEAGLAVPLVKYKVLFAPGAELSLVPAYVYPGPVLWRAFLGRLFDEL